MAVSTECGYTTGGVRYFGIGVRTYQLVDGVCAHRVDDVEQELQDEYDKQEGRHGGRDGKGWTAGAQFIVGGGPEELCHTMKLGRGVEARAHAGINSQRPSTAVPTSTKPD